MENRYHYRDTGKGTFTVRNGVFTPVLERRRGIKGQGSDGLGTENESSPKRFRGDRKCGADLLLIKRGTAISDCASDHFCGIISRTRLLFPVQPHK